jgi:hypothetical protein
MNLKEDDLVKGGLVIWPGVLEGWKKVLQQIICGSKIFLPIVLCFTTVCSLWVRGEGGGWLGGGGGEAFFISKTFTPMLNLCPLQMYFSHPSLVIYFFSNHTLKKKN